MAATDERADTTGGRDGSAWCPSGAAYAPESVVLGVRSGVDGHVAYLPEPVPTATALATLPEGIEPRRLLRIASHCVSACANRRGDDCTLIERVVAAYPDEGPGVPRCHLRPRCKWWGQTGIAACRRCPEVATRHHSDTEQPTPPTDPPLGVGAA
jgi:hypothetical protein